jgi:hypothetical protein
MFKFRKAFIALTLALIGLAGCGEDDSSKKPPGKLELTAEQAEAIKKRDTEVDAEENAVADKSKSTAARAEKAATAKKK